MNVSKLTVFAVAVAAFVSEVVMTAQQYPEGVIDKTVAVVGNEMISIS